MERRWVSVLQVQTCCWSRRGCGHWLRTLSLNRLSLIFWYCLTQNAGWLDKNLCCLNQCLEYNEWYWILNNKVLVLRTAFLQLFWIPLKFLLGHFSIRPLLDSWPHCSLCIHGGEGCCCTLNTLLEAVTPQAKLFNVGATLLLPAFSSCSNVWNTNTFQDYKVGLKHLHNPDLSVCYAGNIGNLVLNSLGQTTKLKCGFQWGESNLDSDGSSLPNAFQIFFPLVLKIWSIAKVFPFAVLANWLIAMALNHDTSKDL